jgi:hypothetical protein
MITLPRRNTNDLVDQRATPRVPLNFGPPAVLAVAAMRLESVANYPKTSLVDSPVVDTNRQNGDLPPKLQWPAMEIGVERRIAVRRLASRQAKDRPKREAEIHSRLAHQRWIPESGGKSLVIVPIWAEKEGTFPI